ncbi:hypothetical protein [Gloeothece verrucosa]|uniref:Uncharacterized protein n=1 Tax=Gloeothece verrucosa (strain PCC 7822) TaxID=497965 RepID=E0UMN4_GLOV7|nr:hypothetical protein [Gloeothece verrucosa]ADN18214.1 conserved hypothetical protein [Gloeothece verrucosa PCC 7822]
MLTSKIFKIKFSSFFPRRITIFGLINFFLWVNFPPVWANDLNNLTFEKLPPLPQAGSVKFPNGAISKKWSAGQPITEILTLGDFRSSYQFQKLTLAQLLSYRRTNQPYTLNDFGYLKKINLNQLLTDVPGLPDYRVAQLPWLQDLLTTQNFNLAQTRNLTFLNLLKSYPKGGQLSLTLIPLNRYNLTSIPRLINLPLERLTGWENLSLKEVPGLVKIPLSTLIAKNNQISLKTPDEVVGKALKLANFTEPATLKIANTLPGFATVDLVLGTAERPATRTMSGGYNVGFAVPCTHNCAHIELAGNFLVAGKQWISGKYQKVDGGSGCLKAVNGGKEPTGRHPYGSGFKVVLWDTNESTDTATLSLFFRSCDFCGCTPYFIGPIKFASYRTGQPIFVGF